MAFNRKQKERNMKQERTDLAGTITPTALFFAPVQKCMATSPTFV